MSLAGRFRNLPGKRRILGTRTKSCPDRPLVVVLARRARRPAVCPRSPTLVQASRVAPITSAETVTDAATPRAAVTARRRRPTLTVLGRVSRQAPPGGRGVVDRAPRTPRSPRCGRRYGCLSGPSSLGGFGKAARIRRMARPADSKTRPTASCLACRTIRISG